MRSAGLHREIVSKQTHKYFRGLERWLRGKEHLLLLQRTRVPFSWFHSASQPSRTPVSEASYSGLHEHLYTCADTPQGTPICILFKIIKHKTP